MLTLVSVRLLVSAVGFALAPLAARWVRAAEARRNGVGV